ncbi:hypothetical protein BN2475_190188 [Paraburkholderia ribeironis]|uniref:Uncharacterized protein n=1 Tax=Paraburkholderia ribeironis TaxID=1247936 RepID=A0A1N7RW26_9BURK|nr:hypothetical protein [Paraburkholderia ribeironis]SIT39326.1 hypothetical protein BN2475_190188 [Paraburkholderia ribeironis]
MTDQRETRPPVLPNEQKPMGAPVVHAPGLPFMESVGEVRTVLRNMALPLMAADAATEVSGEHLMEKAGTMSEMPPSHNSGPQRASEVTMPTRSDGYLRLEVRFENGKLSVIGAKIVPGALTNPTALIQGKAYEVLIADQQISVGSLPDVGVRRAFANRDVPGPEGKHRFVQVPAFEFFVRVPTVHITAENLSKMNVILYEVRETPDRLVPTLAMQKQPGVEAMEVVRVSGIQLESIPEVVRLQLEAIIDEKRNAH